MKENIFIENINGNATSRPPVWFMRQAGRILPSYLKLKQKHSFDEMMQSKQLAAKVTLLPIDDLGVDAGAGAACRRVSRWVGGERGRRCCACGRRCLAVLWTVREKAERL